MANHPGPGDRWGWTRTRSPRSSKATTYPQSSGRSKTASRSITTSAATHGGPDADSASTAPAGSISPARASATPCVQRTARILRTQRRVPESLEIRPATRSCPLTIPPVVPPRPPTKEPTRPRPHIPPCCFRPEFITTRKSNGSLLHTDISVKAAFPGGPIPSGRRPPRFAPLERTPPFLQARLDVGWHFPALGGMVRRETPPDGRSDCEVASSGEHPSVNTGPGGSSSGVSSDVRDH